MSSPRCSPALLWNKPAVQTSDADAPPTDSNTLNSPGRGTGTIRHRSPSQCSAMATGWNDALTRYPTVHTSLAETTPTAFKLPGRSEPEPARSTWPDTVDGTP